VNALTYDPATSRLLAVLDRTINRVDTDAHLATIDAATGATADVGAMGVDKVKSLTVDSGGTLRGVSGSAGAAPLPCPCPSPSPAVSPSPSPSPSPTPVISPPPSPAVSPAAVVRSSPPPSPSVLGVQFVRTPTLPVTGLDAVRLLALAGLCAGAGKLLLGVAAWRGRRARSPE
jgi:hypothetical protein